MKFENRTAVVTGAAGGIGRALCRKYAELGVAVALTDRSADMTEKAAEEIRRLYPSAVIRGYEMDVTNMESVRRAYDAVLADFGKVDILINNAGRWPNVPFMNLNEENWLGAIDLNLNGVFRVTRVFMEALLKNGYGRIVNLGSIAGEVGLPGYSAYSASKAGVIMLTKTLAMEFACKNITVNCVSPGMVSGTDGEPTPTKGTWLGRTGSREEMANLIAFLSADDAAFITGVDYTIDGGRILGPRFSDFSF